MVDGGVYTRRDPKEKARVRKMAREWARRALAEPEVAPTTSNAPSGDAE